MFLFHNEQLGLRYSNCLCVSGVLTICQDQSVTAQYEGVIESPSDGIFGNRDCTLVLTDIPQYSLVELELTSIDLYGNCKDSSQPHNYMKVLEEQDEEVHEAQDMMCQEEHKFHLYYGSSGGSVTIIFFSSNYTKGQWFSLKYKGKTLNFSFLVKKSDTLNFQHKN